MTKVKRIGLYGGSFDPIHIGHINLAMQLKEAAQLDEVWFIPASQSPFKNFCQQTSVEDRCQMVQLAIESFPFFCIKYFEKNREGPSYTVDTVNEILINSSSNTLFFLLMGDDLVGSFHKWYKCIEIVSKVELLVGSRHGFDTTVISQEASEEIVSAIKSGWLKTAIFDVCSTEVRERLQQNKCCHHYLDAKVLSYIQDQRLYLRKKN